MKCFVSFTIILNKLNQKFKSIKSINKYLSTYFIYCLRKIFYCQLQLKWLLLVLNVNRLVTSGNTALFNKI